MNLTQEKLKFRLRYKPETGIFYWLNPPRGRLALTGLIAGCNSRGYVAIGVDGLLYYAHRLAWLYVYGYFPVEIDHRNRSRADNRICNLRECTSSQNGLNLTKYRDNGLPIGVYRSGVKFQSKIAYKGKRFYLGVFDTPEEALGAYQAKRQQLLTGWLE